MKVIIHFGFPKTGSSTLQYGLFKPLHEVGEINLRTWRQDDMSEHHDRRPSSKLFCNKPILDEYLEFYEDKTNILSDESFTAPVKLRVNNFGKDIVDPITFPSLIKEQIEDKYGNDVEIEAFISIRNQVDQIYSQYVEEYNLKRYKNVDLVFDENGKVNLKGFEIYFYDRYINELEKVFGKEKVHVTFFEDWINNFEHFCGQLESVFYIDKDVIANSLTKNHVNKKKKEKDGYYTKDGEIFIPKFTDEQNKAIAQFFEEDNKKLSLRFPRDYDLHKLGYLR